MKNFINKLSCNLIGLNAVLGCTRASKHNLKTNYFSNIILFFSFLFLINNVLSSQSISTSFTNNNGSSISVFTFYNGNPYPVIINSIGAYSSATNASNPSQFWTKPATGFGQGTTAAVSTANGWTLQYSQTASTTANTTASNGALAPIVLSGMSFTVPSNSYYQFCVTLSSLRYSTLGTQTATFTANGCTIDCSTNNGFGGTLTGLIASRGFIGTVNFTAGASIAAPPAVVQSTLAPTCLTGAVLSVPGTPAANETWYWQTSASGTSTLLPTTSNYTANVNGTYYVRTYNSLVNNWSINSTSVSVTNIPTAPLPPSPVAGASPACLNTTLSVPSSTNPNVYYYWEGTSAIGTNTNSPATAPLTVTSTGTYYVNAFDVSTNCWSNAAGIPVVIQTNVPAVPTSTLSNLNVCQGSPSAVIMASVTSSATLSWWNSPTLGILQSTVTPLQTVGTSVLPNTSTPGTYTFYAQSQLGVCSSSTRLPITVTVLNLPSNPTVSNSTQCGVGVSTASVTGSTAYNWYASPTSTTVLQTGASQNYTTSINSTTTWYVASLQNSCESNLRVAVTTTVTNPDAVIASSSSPYVCIGSSNSATLTATKIGTSNTYSYTWNASPSVGSGISSSVSGSTVVVNPTVAGTYTYGLMATDGVCNAVSSVTLMVNDLPPITALATPSLICSGSNVSLQATSLISGPQVAPTYALPPAVTYPTSDEDFANITIKKGTTTILNNSTPNNSLVGTLGTATGVAGSYSDFTSFGNFPLLPGSVYTFSISTSTSGTSYSNGMAIYIDYNRNGVFTEANEKVYASTATTSGPHTETGSFTVPLTASNGLTRMRIAANEGLITSPTQTFSWGEYEEYMMNINQDISSTLAWQWNPGTINTQTTTVNPTNSNGSAALSVYTVTATYSTTGCSNTATVGVLVNQIPSAPIVTNSSQCGLGVSAASLVGGAAYNWYASPTSTAVLQTGSISNYTTAINATTTWYVTSTDGTCESTPRTPITTTVSAPVALVTNVSNPTLCIGTTNTAILTATSTNANYTYSWTSGGNANSGMPVSVLGQSTAITPTLAGVYSYSVIANDGICTAISIVTVSLNSAPEVYAYATSSIVCAAANVGLNVNSGPQVVPSYTLPPAVTYPTNDEDFASIILKKGTTTILSNSSANNSLVGTIGTATGVAGSYSNFTSFGNYLLVRGSVYTFTLGSSTSGTAYSNALAIYIDYNRNGVFTDAGEQVYTSAATTSGAHTETGSFTVPLSASKGLTRMRLISNEGLISSPTQAVYYGEYEEYTMNIGEDLSGYTWQWNPGAINTQTATVNPINTSSIAVNSIYTVTATNATTGCSATGTVGITVNAIPTAPTVANSSQCGYGIPTASVSGGVYYNWYATPTSTNALQSGAISNFTSAISNTTTWYVASYNGMCESSRAMITESVTVADVVTATASNSVFCYGSLNTVTLTATKTGTNNVYAYSWSATPSLGSGMTSVVSGSVVSVTPTLPGNYVYNLLASDGVCSANAVATFTLRSLPPVTTLATPSVICSGGAVNLNAQSVNLTVGTATVGSSLYGTTTSSPYNQGAGITMERKVQYLYTKAELNAAGIYGGNITDMKFNATTVGAGAINNFTIKMGHTTTSALTTAYEPTPVNLVYGPYTYSVSLGANVHSFDTPFLWDGNSNVLIEICHDAVSSGSVAGTSSSVSYTYTSANSTIYSAAVGACTLTTGSATTLRPLIAFTGNLGTNTTSSNTFVWNPGSVNSNTAAINPVNAGALPVSQIYTVSLTNTLTTCSNTGTVAVVVNPIPTTPVVSDATQCGVAVPTASVSGGTSYLWYSSPTATNVLQSGASPNYSTSINTTTSWYVTSINSGSCTSPRAMVTQSVTIPDAVTASASTNTLCPNTPLVLTAVKTGSANTYAYTWTSTSGSGITTSVTGSSVTLTPPNPGTYTYVVTAIDGACTAISTKSVTVIYAITVPPIVSGTSNPICVGNSVGLSEYFPVTGPAVYTLPPAVTYPTTDEDFANITIKSGTTTVLNNSTPINSLVGTIGTATGVAGSYSDFTAFGPYNITAGALHTFTIASSTTGTAYSNGMAIYIDYNRNGVFTDAGEQVYTSATTTSGAHSETGSFTVPSSAFSGLTRMRVIAREGGGINSPNIAVSWGEFEEYMLNIISSNFGGGAAPAFASFVWSNGASTVATTSVTTQTPTVNTNYVLTATDVNGCVISSAPYTVTVNPLPSVLATTSNSTVCSGNTAVLSATGATSYTWSTGSTVATETVTPTSASVYTVIGTSSNGCSNSATVSVGYNTTPVISAVNSTICVGESYTIAPTGALSYSYSGGTNIVSPLVNTTYTITGDNGTGCLGTAIVNLDVNALPTITLNGGVICTGETYTITPSGAVTYTYSGGSNIVSPSTTTSYSVIGTSAQGCLGTAVMTLTVNPSLLFNTNSGSICEGSSFTITPTGAATYSFSSGSAIVTPTANSTYTVTGISATGCSGTAISSVTVYPIPSVSATASQTLLCDDGSTGASILSASTNATTYMWSNGAITMITSVTPTVTSTYTVTVFENGCSSSAYVTVAVNNCSGVKELDNNLISIYPNPTKGMLNVSVLKEMQGVTSVEVYDAIGKLVLKENITNQTSILNVSNIEEGMYMIRVINNGKLLKTEKLVKQ